MECAVRESVTPHVPVPWNESARIARLTSLRGVDRDDVVLGRLTRIAAAATGLPVALVTLVEQDHQRCVAQYGGEPLDTIPREMAFCAHAILRPGTALVVPDAEKDVRFADNPLVTGPAGLRFYVGVPLSLPGDDFAVGALCVVDTKPHAEDSVDLQTLGLIGQEIAQHLASCKRPSDGLSRARELLSGLGVGAAVLEGDELTINAALSSMTGYDSQELQTLDRWFQVLFGSSAALERQRYEIARERAFRVPAYSVIKRKDGEERTLEISRSNGDGAEVWILNDITTSREAQDALMSARDEAIEAARARTAILQTMSHEIRTPMNGVYGMTDALLHTQLTPAQREFAETVRAQSESLLHVLDEILDFSELEAQRVQIKHEPFSPRAVVEDACHAFVETAARKKLSLVVDSAGVSEAALGDAARLRQVIANVVSSAVKLTELGEVVIKACTEPCVDGKLLLRITVGDTGVGLATPGLGLGLAVARTIILLMGGELMLESEVGRGSTATITVVLDEGSRMPHQWERRFSGRRALLLGAGAAMEALEASLLAFGAEVLRGDASNVDPDASRCDVWFVAEAALSAPLFRDLSALPPVVAVKPTAAVNNLPEHTLALSTPLRQPAVASLMQSAIEGGHSHRRAGMAHGVLGGHALVVDDNPVNVKVAVAMLGRLGWTADIANDGVQAIAAARARRYDVVLMDCQMPVLDGYEATRRLRDLPETSSAFVVALTANALTGDRERCSAAGMDDFLSKPLRPPELLRVLKEAVAKRR